MVGGAARSCYYPLMGVLLLIAFIALAVLLGPALSSLGLLVSVVILVGVGVVALADWIQYRIELFRERH